MTTSGDLPRLDHLSLSERWRACLIALLRRAASQLSAGDLADPRLIKQIRALMKQSGALLRLSPRSFQPSARGIRNKVRDLRKRLGRARDAEAVLEALDGLVPRSGIHAAALREIRPRFVARARKMVSAMSSVQALAAATMLSRAALELAAAPVNRQGDKDLVTQAKAAYRKAKGLVPTRLARVTPDRLHDFRTAVVIQRFQTEFLQAESPKAGEKRVRKLQKLRDTLGEYHDLHLLAEALAGLPSPQDRRFEPLIDGPIAARQKALARQAQAKGEKLFGKPPAREATLGAASKLAGSRIR